MSSVADIGRRFGLRLTLVVGIALLLTELEVTGVREHLEWKFIRHHWLSIKLWSENNPEYSLGLFGLVYTGATALSLPVAAPLSLLGGALFGQVYGTVVISLAATTGATLAMLASRYLLRGWVESRYTQTLEWINQGIRRDGWSYLLTLRLIPLVPFWLINLALGLSAMPARTFALISWLGMLPGVFLYTNAGTQLATIESPSDVLTPRVLGAFALLAAIPLVLKQCWFLKSTGSRSESQPRPAND
jgi:uncharacterized membrane protein YdjX (TVP38/TMEM64 family)